MFNFLRSRADTIAILTWYVFCVALGTLGFQIVFNYFPQHAGQIVAIWVIVWIAIFCLGRHGLDVLFHWLRNRPVPAVGELKK